MTISAKTGDFVHTLNAFISFLAQNSFFFFFFAFPFPTQHVDEVPPLMFGSTDLKSDLFHPRLDDYLGPTVQLILTLIPIPYMSGYPWHTRVYYLVNLWSAGAHSLSRHPSKSAQWLIDMHPLSPIYMYQIWGRGFWSD